MPPAVRSQVYEYLVDRRATLTADLARTHRGVSQIMENMEAMGKAN